MSTGGKPGRRRQAVRGNASVHRVVHNVPVFLSFLFSFSMRFDFYIYFSIVTSYICFCYYNRTHETGKVVKEKGLCWLTVWGPKSMVLVGALSLWGGCNPVLRASGCDRKKEGQRSALSPSALTVRPQLLRTELSLRVTSPKAPAPNPRTLASTFQHGLWQESQI